MKSVAVRRPRRGPWRKCKILVFRRRRGDVGTKRNCKILISSPVFQANDKDARTPGFLEHFRVCAVFCQQLFINGYDLHEFVLTKEWSPLCSKLHLQVSDILRFSTPSLPEVKHTSALYSCRNARRAAAHFYYTHFGPEKQQYGKIFPPRTSRGAIAGIMRGVMGRARHGKEWFSWKRPK